MNAGECQGGKPDKEYWCSVFGSDLLYDVMGRDDPVSWLESNNPDEVTAILRRKIREIDGVTNAVKCRWL
jgi:hypothetical protein